MQNSEYLIITKKKLGALAATVMNVAIVWDIATRSLFVDRRFGAICDVNLQGKTSAEQEPSVQHVTRYSVWPNIPEDNSVLNEGIFNSCVSAH
jgi:hypothetical protein